MIQKKKFNIKKFIKRAVLVTAILALVEVIIIFFFMNDKKENKEEAKTEVKTDSASTEPASGYGASGYATNTETSKASQPAEEVKAPEASAGTGYNTTTASATTPAPATTSNAVETQPAAVPHPATETKSSVVKTNPHANNPVVRPKPKPEVIAASKQLSDQKMEEIYNNITEEKKKNYNTSKCITIKKSGNSNVSNAFDIGDYLKGKGFIISGRSMDAGNQKGISINAKGSCITLTIGAI